MTLLDQDEEVEQDEPQPDPNIYAPPDEQDNDELELDRRIRRAHERLRRMSMVGFPQINEEFGCQDTLTVEGGFDTGWSINYLDCGKHQEAIAPPVTCPNTVTVTFNGISFCCVVDMFGNYFLFEDLFGFLGTPATLPSATPCPGSGLDCSWLIPGDGSSFLIYVHNGTTNCDFPDDIPTTLPILVFVAKIGATWYVWAVAQSLSSLFTVFLGSGTDPSSIPNIVPCSNSILLTSPVITWWDCSLGGSVTGFGAGTGGYATIS